MDDILIHSYTIADHMKQPEYVLNQLCHHCDQPVSKNHVSTKPKYIF